MTIKGTILFEGQAKGKVLFLESPISFYGGVDPDSGRIIQKNHPQFNKHINNKILILPYSTGSTVGSWTILRLKKRGVAPLAFISLKSDTVLATGSIISKIPHVDKVNINLLKNSQIVSIHGDEIEIEKTESDNSQLESLTAPYPYGNDPQLPEHFQAHGLGIKIGGSLLTDKTKESREIKEETLSKIATTLSEIKKPLFIVHGAGTYGHNFVQKHDLLYNNSPMLWGELQSLQYELNNKVTKILRENGIPAFPVQASSILEFIFGYGSEKINVYFQNLLSAGVVPVLYGTPYQDNRGEFKILSGDTILVKIAEITGIKHLISLTDVDGVFNNINIDSSPLEYLTAEKYSNIAPVFSKSESIDVTGSMRKKVETLLSITNRGVVSYIINGKNDEEIERAVNGKKAGTIITSQA